MSQGQPFETMEVPNPARPMDTYSIATPYGTVTISQGGRKVTFDLYSDIKQSRHNTALFTYVQQLKSQGISRFNTDHLNIPGRDKTMSLVRGKARLDLIYEQGGKTYECELKTSREIGLDVTARQLTELVKWCDRLTLLVPRGCLEEAATILNMINLDHQITIAPYDGVGDED
ncbi:hypothetical protein ES708_14064 [subsurface metagenome]